MANDAAAAANPDHQAAIEAAVNAAIASARATSIQRSEASEIARLCVDSGVPAMAASLLAEGVTLAQARERIGAASQIKELVVLARSANKAVPEGFADELLAAGKTVEQARSALFDLLVAKEAGADAVRSSIDAVSADANALRAGASQKS